MNLTNLIGLAFTSIMSQPHLRNKWLTAAGIVSMIKKRYNFEGDLDFNETKFHGAMTKYTVNCIDIQDATNQTGVFRIKRDLKSNKDRPAGSKRWLWLYYVTDPGKPMGDLPLQSMALAPRAIKEANMKSPPSPEEPQSGQRAKRKRRPVMDWNKNSKDDSNVPDSPQETLMDQPEKSSGENARKKRKEAWNELYKEAQEICNQEVERRDSKRQRVKDTVDQELERRLQVEKDKEMEKKALERAEQAKAIQLKLVERLKVMCYFDSTEAKSVFCPKEDETVQECIKRRIEFLSSIITDPDGYSRLLAVSDDEDAVQTREPSLSQRHRMLHKAMILRLSYMYSLDMMDKGHSFKECCQKAIDELKHATSFELITDPNVVQRLNREFRENERFQPPFQRSRKTDKVSKKESCATDEDVGSHKDS